MYKYIILGTQIIQQYQLDVHELNGVAYLERENDVNLWNSEVNQRRTNYGHPTMRLLTDWLARWRH